MNRVTPSFSASPLARRTVRFASLALLLASSVSFLPAATFTWDSGGASPVAPSSAAGNWNTTNAYWSNGATDSTWNNAGNNIAAFLGAGYTVTVTEPITVGGLVYDQAGTVTISGSTLTLNSGAVIQANNNSALLNISSVITGTNGLTKTGAGGVTLQAANTYTGATSLTGGTVRLGVNDAISTGTALTLTSSSLLTEGKNQTVASLAGNGTVRNRNTVSASTFTINGASGSTTYSGAIGVTADNVQANSKALNIVKDGASTLILTSTSGLVYNGTTTVSGGILRLNAGANLITTSGVIINGGTLLNAGGNNSLGIGDVTMSSGAITLGTSPTTAASFTVAANKNFTTTGGQLNFDVGTSFDQVIGSGTGTFSLTNTTLALTTGTGFDYSLTYALFNGFASGTTNNLAITGYDTASWVAALGNNGVLSFSATAVPEPSTYAILGGLATLGFVIVRRRANKNRQSAN